MSTASEVLELLTPNGKTGPDVTHGLKALGGTMQEGLRIISEFFYTEGLQQAAKKLKAEKRCSFIGGSAVTACIFSAVGAVLYWHHTRQEKMAEMQHTENGRRILKCMQETTPKIAQENDVPHEEIASKTMPEIDRRVKMSKFRVIMVDDLSGEVLETDDNVFDDEQEAEDYACECGGAYAQGAEDLSLMGRDYDDPGNVRFEVEEIDD